MKIYDTSGNELERDEIDFSQGRLLQGEEEGTLVFTTWVEKPDEEGTSNTAEPSQEERIAALEMAMAEMMLEM